MDKKTSSRLDRNTPALALSGGGFRATLFHCGALLRLNELGYLTRVSRISSVSGGSITSGMLAAAWPRLTAHNGVFTNLTEEVIEPLRAFCRRSIDESSVGWGAFLPGKTIGDVLADAYDDLFKGISLQSLPDSPQFVFNATNLQTGRLVRMQKQHLAEYTIGMVLQPDIRLAVAVAASSAFPPVLSPVEIEIDPASWVKMDGAFHYGDPHYNRKLALTDGGVYDNLGLEAVDDFNPVIVSDAGAPFGTEETVAALWPKQVMRALDIATDQARGLRKRLLFAEAAASGRTVAFSGIDSEFDRYPAPQQLQVLRSKIDWMASLRTRLNPFSDVEQGHLIYWGWVAMDASLRSYAVFDVPPPTAFPFPEYDLSQS